MDPLNIETNTVASFNNSSLVIQQIEDRGWNGTEIQDSQFRHVIRMLDYYIVPIIVVVGLAGNSLSCVAFLMTSLKTLSSSVYLASLAVADSGFLVCVLFSWSTNLGVGLYNMPFGCQFFTFSSYVFSFLSVWLVVGFTVERYIATCFPFKRNEMCTPRRAKLVVAGLTTLAVLIYSYALWTSSVQAMHGQQLCMPISKYIDFLKLTVNIDTTLTFLIPFLAIFILNVRIVCAVTRIKQQHIQVSAIQDSPTAPSFTQNRIHTKVTTMLLVVSTSFLLLNLPKHILHILSMEFLNHLVLNSTNYSAISKLVTYIFYLNFSINFFLYSLCGKNFRVALRILFKRKRKLKKRCKRQKGNTDTSLNKSFNSLSNNLTNATAV